MEDKQNKPKTEGVLDYDFFDENQCKMLNSGLIPSFKTKINMHLPSGKKGLLTINCIEVIEPKMVQGTGIGIVIPEITEEDSKVASLIRSANEFAEKILFLKLWYIYAEIGDAINKKHLWISVLPGYFAAYSFQRPHLYDPRVLNN